MANGETRSRPASRVVSEFADLAAKGAQLYPTLMQAGITYWVKWLDLELGYYGTAARQWARAVQEPRRQPEHVQKMIDDFKAFLLSLAEVPGQAVLSFNQRVEELLREPAEDPAASPAQALSRRVRKGLAQLAESAEFKRVAAKAKGYVALPDAAKLVDALAKLDEAHENILRLRREVHVAAESVLQATRQLATDLEQEEETPADVLRRLVADLEQFNVSVASASKPEK